MDGDAPDGMQGHVIVCGLQGVGLRAVEQFHLSGTEVVVIDDDADPRRWRTLDDLLHSDKGVTVGRDDDGKLTPTIGNPGSTKAPDLMVSIDPVTVAKIRSHLETQGIEDSPRAYLFATRDGQLPDPSNVQKMWKAAVRKAGLGNVTPAIGTHDLRRFSARPCTRTAYPWQSSKPDSGTLTSASPRSTSVLAQKPTGRRLTPLQPLWLASPIRRSKPQTQPTVLVAARGHLEATPTYRSP